MSERLQAAAKYRHCLLAEMASCLRSTGVDLGNETACIVALTHARFRARDISVLLDEAIEQARAARARAFFEPPDTA